MDRVRGVYYFNKIVKGFLFHLVGRVASAAFHQDLAMLFLGSIGWYFIISGIYGLRSEMRCPFKGGYRALFFFYIWICVIMIIRGYLIDYPFQWLGLPSMINYHFFEPTYILCYLMPVVAYIPSKYYSFNLLSRFSVWGAIGCVVLLVVFYPVLANASAMAVHEGRIESDIPMLSIMGLCISFMLLCRKYLPKKSNIIVLIGYMAKFIVIILFARRGGVAVTLAILLIYIWFLFERKAPSLKFFLFVFLLIAGFGAYMLYDSLSMFDYLKERGTTDTRSYVVDTMLGQMDSMQKLFGEGLNGRYYCPLNIESDDAFGGWRYGVETGFYNLVLKGGYLMAITYIILLLIPSLKGMFNSRNLLCKIGGAYVFLSILELYPHGWLGFNVQFLIIWMCIAMCMSPQFRYMSDDEIQRYLFSDRITS